MLEQLGHQLNGKPVAEMVKNESWRQYNSLFILAGTLAADLVACASLVVAESNKKCSSKKCHNR